MYALAAMSQMLSRV